MFYLDCFDQYRSSRGIPRIGGRGLGRGGFYSSESSLYTFDPDDHSGNQITLSIILSHFKLPFYSKDIHWLTRVLVNPPGIPGSGLYQLILSWQTQQLVVLNDLLNELVPRK